jgi:hypothetical protein
MGRREEGQTDTMESNSVIAGQDLSVKSSQGPLATIGSPHLDLASLYGLPSSLHLVPQNGDDRAVRPFTVSTTQETSPTATKSIPRAVKHSFTIRPTQTTSPSATESNLQIARCPSMVQSAQVVSSNADWRASGVAPHDIQTCQHCRTCGWNRSSRRILLTTK